MGLYLILSEISNFLSEILLPLNISCMYPYLNVSGWKCIPIFFILVQGFVMKILISIVNVKSLCEILASADSYPQSLSGCLKLMSRSADFSIPKIQGRMLSRWEHFAVPFLWM